MKMRAATGVLAVCLVSALVAGRAMSDDKPGSTDEAKSPSPEEMKTMMEGMKAWLEAIEPSQHHELLDQFVGSWKTTTKMWMGGPGSSPTVTQGTSDVKWVLGKRFLMEEHAGKMPMPDMTGAMNEVPYEGIGIMGYDNHRNTYVGTWMSNLATNILTMKGSVDPAGKLFRSYGEMDEPMLGVVGRTVKYVTRVISKDKHVFEIFDLHAGDDYKVIEITYTRK